MILAVVPVILALLLDTLVVRSVLVSSLTLDLGHRVWWPSRLDRPGAGRTGEARARAAVGGGQGS
jgi:RND superfamily putative drug exporter